MRLLATVFAYDYLSVSKKVIISNLILIALV